MTEIVSLEPRRLSPYQGLVPYREEDWQFFFGREKEIRIIIANLFAAPLTLLYGASGVGKSSVLRAGVVSQLRQHKDLIVIMFNTWKGDPIDYLKVAVHAVCPSIPISPAESLTEYLSACTTQLNRRLIVILDQFEEYFLYHPQKNKDDKFVIEFSEAVAQPDLPHNFLISIREDSLAKLDRFEGYIPTLFDNFLRLDHLDRNSATEAITKPIGKYNELIAEPGFQFEVEKTLVGDLIKTIKPEELDLGQMGRGMLAQRHASSETDDIRVEAPYLQLVLMRLWNEEVKRKSRVLRLATLTSLGGAKQIIHTHLDTMMMLLKSYQQEVASYIFHYLITPSGTKIALSIIDLEQFTGIPSRQIQNVVNRLSESEIRILQPVASGGEDRDDFWYEIYHDALAPAIVDWRNRYLSQKPIFQQITSPVIFLVLFSLIVQAFPQLSNLGIFMVMLRGLSYFLLHAMTLLQVYQWFYQQVKPKIITLPIIKSNGRNLGLLLSILLPTFWLTSTKWPDGSTLWTISFEQYILYLFTLVLTLAVGLIVFFLFMQSAGKLTYRLFRKRYDLGFFGMYIFICVLISVLIILTLLGVTSRWIAL